MCETHCYWERSVLSMKFTQQFLCNSTRLLLVLITSLSHNAEIISNLKIETKTVHK